MTSPFRKWGGEAFVKQAAIFRGSLMGDWKEINKYAGNDHRYSEDNHVANTQRSGGLGGLRCCLFVKTDCKKEIAHHDG